MLRGASSTRAIGCSATVLALAVGPATTAATGARDSAGKTFARAGFSNPTKIDNRWFPLVPGTRFTLVGRADRGHGRRSHRVVFTVTDLTKVIDGVRTVVIWDRDYNAGRLLETELAFNAQDDDGTVWNFGEYPEEHEHGRVARAPDTWIVGLAGAKAGIAMRADPRIGTPSYLQGWAPAIDFSDRARVYRTGRRICVPVRCFEDVLETDEWNPTEHGAHERKYYAAGLGNIRVGAVGGTEREALVLANVEHLGPGAMAAVRKQALKLDRRAYRVRSDLYRHTPRAERMRAAG
jgi:hypothetical protein